MIMHDISDEKVVNDDLWHALDLKNLLGFSVHIHGLFDKMCNVFDNLKELLKVNELN